MNEVSDPNHLKSQTTKKRLIDPLKQLAVMLTLVQAVNGVLGQSMTNVALATAGATIEANSSFLNNCNCYASHVIDGNINSVWAPVQGVYPWTLTVTLAQVQLIKRINLVEGVLAPAFTTTGRIEYNNGAGWLTLTNFSKGSAGLDFTLETPVVAQQVRYVGTRASAPGGWWNYVPFICEFEIHALLVPHAATATATTTNGYFVIATITDPGYGYTNTPGVRIIGGGGTGAQAIAQVESGLVTNVAILNPGSGYTNTPIIIIAPPFIPQPKMNITALSQLSFSNLAVGTNYQLQSINEGNLADVGLPFTAANSSFIQMVSGNVLTNQYRLAVTPVPSQAQATAQVAGGFVVGATLTSGGSGYITAPVVSILGAGSNATAIAYVNGGCVTNISITGPGIGYVTGATIVIAPPPATVIWPNSVSQVMKVDLGSFPLGSLSPYDNYQLEFMPAANGTWANVGSVFVPTAATHTLYIPVTGDTGFLRVAHLY